MTFNFPKSKQFHNIHFLQDCRALSRFYWTQVSEKINMCKKIKRRKMTFEVSKKKDLQSNWFRGEIDLWFLFSLFANGPPIFIFYKGRALSRCYWTKTSEEMNMYKQRKRRKILKNCHFFKIATYSNLCKSLLNLVWEQSTRQSGGHFKSKIVGL